MRTTITLITLCALLSLGASAQNVDKVENDILDNYARTEINLPQVDGLLPLKADLHVHTLLSDGAVWPTVRIDEAWRDGLDIVAMTDHIEYRPHNGYLKSDHNASYIIAKPTAEKRDILLIRACEMTRAKSEGGHLNMLFINDANPFDTEKMEDAVNEAVRQGAFVTWNHPGWPDNICDFNPINAKWIKEGKIHAVEVFNEKDYYPYATTWCNEHNLAPIAASDVHPAIRDLYKVGVRRPFTIIFAKERTLESVRSAMNARRTLAVFNNQVAGNEELLVKFFKASAIKEMLLNGSYKLTNNSDIEWVTNFGVIKANQTIMVDEKNAQKPIEVYNFYPSHTKSLVVEL